MLSILEALYSIDPATTDYQKWITYGMALKHASLSDPTITWQDWDNWSRGDTRPGMYIEGQCQKKWDSFQSTGITEASIFYDALKGGYRPHFDGTDPINWDGVIEYDGNDESSQIRDTIKYFNLLFEPEDTVNYVLKSSFDKNRGKFSPVSTGVNRTAKDIIAALNKYQDISQSLGDYDEKAGGWIRFNPTDGKGVKNSNIADFRYCLIESDKISLEEQFKKILELKLPCVAIVYSGSKSLHAIMHVDAENQEEYTKRVKWIYSVLEDNDFPVDQNNKNPSRMSRLPGLKRGKSRQTLVRGKTGLNSFLDWEDFIKNDLEDENLPEIENYKDVLENPPVVKDELIGGVLRFSHKMIIQGASKSGKSFTLIDLATCVAEGKEWLGFECAQGKVLYINFEIDRASFYERLRMVYEAKGWEPTAENIEVWNLRGFSMSAEKLIPKIIKRARSMNLSLIVLDPIYKIQAGDENSAGDISKFTNEIDKLCTELNCSVVYCHHHSKGFQGFKRAMDRSSGSGVFARDADAIIDVIELSNETYINKEGYSDLRAFRIEGTLREFPSFEPVNVFYDFPIYRLDEEGILDKAETYDEFIASKQNKPGRKKDKRTATQRFQDAFNKFSVGSNEVPIKELMVELKVGERRVREMIQQINKELDNRVYITKGKNVIKVK